MKVLHVIDALGRGGAEQLLVTLLPELQRQGVGAMVAVRRPPLDLVPALEQAGIEVHQLAPRHRWNLIGAAREIARQARKIEADIVHAHLYFPAVSVAVMRWLGLSSCPTIVSFHNMAYAGANKAGPGLMAKRWIAGFVYKRGMDRFLAVSQAVADHYSAALGISPVGVLPNPVNVSALKAVAASVGRSPDAKGTGCHIVMPGRIVGEKGHGDLIAALGLLREKGIHPQLTIVGDGPMTPQLRAAVQAQGLEDTVHFAGAVDHSVLLQIVARADLVAVPSRYEGFGLTALEAMALGRAVIATQTGGLPFVVGDTGVLVPPGAPAALADALEHLIDDPARRADLGRRAALRAKAQFDLPEIAAQLIGIYDAMLDERAPIEERALRAE